MTNNPVTLDKEYQTRDGRPVRVHATDIGGEKTVLASVWSDYGGWRHQDYFSDGVYEAGHRSPLDLIEKPKTYKAVFYVNVYKDSDFDVSNTRKQADIYARPDRIACQRFEFEVEEGRFDE